MQTIIHISKGIQKAYKKLTLNAPLKNHDPEAHPGVWNANCIPFLGKKCWILTHSITRYTILIPEVKAADVPNLRELIIRHMTDQLRIVHQVDPEKIERFIGEIAFFPTNGDRSCIAYMNQRIFELQCAYDYNEDFRFDITGSRLNHLTSKPIDGKSQFIRPSEWMIRFLEDLGN